MVVMMLLTNISAPDEGIHHKQDNTQAFIDGKEVGNGSLFITERCGYGGWGKTARQHALSANLLYFPAQQSSHIIETTALYWQVFVGCIY